MVLEGFENVGAICRSGVYALVHRRQVVYIGQSKDMLRRVYSHRNTYGDKRGKNKQFPSWYPVKGILFDDIWVRRVPLDQLNAVEREMIARYRPRFNTQLKPPQPPPLRGVLASVVALQKVPEGFERRA